MKHKYLIILIFSLSIATLACSLTSPDDTSGASQPDLNSSTALVSSTPTAAPAASSTPAPSPTSNATLDSSAAQSPAVAVDTLVNAQGSAAVPFYLTNCAVRTDWPLYTVVAGDTLAGIARRTGATWPLLAQANCLANPSLIYVGQALRVPGQVQQPGNVPVIANPGPPPLDQCNVLVAVNYSVPVYAAPVTGAIVAYLYNYAPRIEDVGDFYRIPLPWGTYGFVSRHVTQVHGLCQQDLPVFTNPGNPPPNSCSAVRPQSSVAYVYPSPQGWQPPIGLLGNFAPIVQSLAGSYEIALQGWNTVGWVRQHDVQLFGDCGWLNGSTPTYTPEPMANLPRVENPGLPPQDRCSVVSNPGVITAIYPGPLNITGPIAVLVNYAPYIDSIDGGYTIGISHQREGWVSWNEAHLEGECVSIFESTALISPEE